MWVMMKRNWNKRPVRSLSLTTLESYLPLNTAGRAKTGYEQDVAYRMKRVLRLFRAEALNNQSDVTCSVTVLPPVNQDEDWRRLVLLIAEICNCHYSLRKTRECGSNGIEVCFTGDGVQPELCTKLLAFLWPRYCQCRYRAWQNYVRSTRRKAGSNIQVTPKVRAEWQQDYSLRWIFNHWQDLSQTARHE